MFPTTKSQETLDLEELSHRIGRAHAPRKEELPWLKLATFGNKPNDKGYLRYNENVTGIAGVELDYDDGTMDIEQAVEVAEKAGLCCLIYTSPSNLLDGKHKWRLLAPFETPLDPAQRDHMMGRINGLYGGIFDPASWTLSQSYFFGYVDGNAANHRVDLIDGMTIDTLHDLDEGWRPKPLHSARFDSGEVVDSAIRRHAFQESQFDYEAAAVAIRSGKNYHNALLSLAAHLSGRGMTRKAILTRILDILEMVPAHLRDHRYKARASLRHLNGILDWVLNKDNTKFTERTRTIDEQARATAAKGPRLLSETEALAMFQPQDWLVQDILERGFLYSMTARSGSGKTAVAVLLSYLMAAQEFYPRMLGGHEVERGNVVFLAGENPVDLVRRMAGLRGRYKLTAQASIAVVMGTFSIKDNIETIAAQIPQDRPLAMVVIDTAQAFFSGAEENSNAEMLAYAQTLRKLTSLPGNPCVLVLCHPSKFVATQAELLPRGGSAFLGEIDGNLTLWPGESETVFEFHHTDKLRGPGFEPIQIELQRYTDASFIDTKGRPSSTVVASVISEQEAEVRTDERSEREKVVLDALSFKKDGMRHGEIVEVTGLPKVTVSRLLTRLMARPPKVEKEASLYRLVKGKKAKVPDE